MVTDIFEYAVRNKVRFQSERGFLTVEKALGRPAEIAGRLQPQRRG